MSEMIRPGHEAAEGQERDDEMKFLRPLMDLQALRSHLPRMNELLIEYFHTDEGYHVVMFPFEGRLVHEGLASPWWRRISEIKPITFSMAMNDYGFELLSDQEIPLFEALKPMCSGSDNLLKGTFRPVSMP